jgi:hypothetical protein
VKQRRRAQYGARLVVPMTIKSLPLTAADFDWVPDAGTVPAIKTPAMIPTMTAVWRR